MKAFAWRSGEIEFGRRCPYGAIPIAAGPARQLRDIVETYARHGYKKGTLLVPGIPEAQGDDDALKALTSFRRLVEYRLAGRSGWPALEAEGSAA